MEKLKYNDIRKIKFRGKDIESNEWLSGDLIQRIGYMPSIMFPYESNGKVRYGECSVKRETVGQFTGLYDKNGTEIYEGDIIASEGYSHARHYVRYLEDEAMFIAMIIGSPLQEWCAIRQSWIDKFDKRVIGNIHDKPELLKGGKK